MDLTKLSDADLMALQAGDLSKVSDAGLAVALGDATRAAMEDQQEQAALALTLQNVTGAGAAQTAQVEKQISAMSRASGVADTDYRKALEALVRGVTHCGDFEFICYLIKGNAGYVVAKIDGVDLESDLII